MARKHALGTTGRETSGKGNCGVHDSWTGILRAGDTRCTGDA
jgi:hypothetical protein